MSEKLTYDDYIKWSRKKLEEKLTAKQKIFCLEYVMDWNATRAAKAACYSEKTASEMGFENLRKPQIKAYIDIIKYDYEQNLGLSKAKVINEHQKIAFSSIAHLHDSWIERKAFDRLTDDEKACIKVIKTNVFEGREMIHVELWSKQDSLKEIAKLMGYNEPDKQVIDNNIKLPTLTTDEIKNISDSFKDEY